MTQLVYFGGLQYIHVCIQRSTETAFPLPLLRLLPSNLDHGLSPALDFTYLGTRNPRQQVNQWLWFIGVAAIQYVCD